VNNKSSNKDLFATVFTTDRNAPLTSTNDATKQSNWFDEDLKDAPIRSFGPIKASTNVRTITVTDFAPDVCKDYKQTGFCGFG
jgi:RING finger protein 113A